MSFNILLIQIVLFSCVFSLLRSPRLPKGWLVVSGLILTVLVIALVQVPQWAGWISGGMWLGLVVVPLVGFVQVNRLFYREQYRQARRISSWLRWLHPADGWQEYPQLLRGLELGKQGRLEEARQVLGQCAAQATATGRMATALLYRMGAEWPELLIWIRQRWTEDRVFKDAAIAIYYLRALGETGEINELVQGVAQFERRFEKSNDVTSLNLVRMYALAFSGRIERVEQLFNGALSVYSKEMKQFWLATTLSATGRRSEAEEMFQNLRQTCDPPLRNAIDWRLAQPPVQVDRVLTESSQHILSQIDTTIHHERRYSGKISARKPYATYSLIGLNVLVFLLEVQLGGSENLDTLYRMGALVPENLVAGEWWRVVSAMFLHYGVVHILVNMLGLYVLGAFVESIVGIKKYLIAYFVCGIGSMLAIGLQAWYQQIPDLIGVGASGAIMGMLGMMAAILLKGWRQDKAKIAARRLRLVLLIAGLQVISDTLMPEVSLVGHASGLVLGFLVGSVLFNVKDFDR